MTRCRRYNASSGARRSRGPIGRAASCAWSAREAAWIAESARPAGPWPEGAEVKRLGRPGRNKDTGAGLCSEAAASATKVPVMLGRAARGRPKRLHHRQVAVWHRDLPVTEVSGRQRCHGYSGPGGVHVKRLRRLGVVPPASTTCVPTLRQQAGACCLSMLRRCFARVPLSTAQ